MKIMLCKLIDRYNNFDYSLFENSKNVYKGIC